MASCDLDYRLSSNSESMEYEEAESSEDEARLSIVEGTEIAIQTGAMSRTFARSLSTGDGSYDGSSVGGGAHNASDAVESLLLLGQRPVFSIEQQDTSGTGSDPGTSSGGMSPPFSRFSSTNQVEQRMMVNYYQKMRERNNEASKRCRLKRRIKQDSLDKTRILLESHREALSHRVAKLHKIKNILNEACRNVGQEDGQCDCLNVCNLIKAANREMPDLLDLTNAALLRKSRKVRETNMEEVLGAEAQSRLSDLRPLKRGPRKQEDTATRLLVDTLAPSSPSGALDLSSSAKSGVNLSSVKREIQIEDKKFNQVTLVSKGYVPLAPKTASLPQIPIRKIIVDNPSLPRISSPILPLFTPGVQVSPSKSTISLPSFNGTNTIILTPLGQPGLPSTIFSLPVSSSSSSSPSTPSSTSSSSSSNPSFTLPATKQEEPVVIKSEPDLGIVAMEEGDQVQVKQETTERDPTTTCCAASANLGPCSQELIDLNSLTQMLDLVTMEPKIAGELTAAEKYIIKSRLRIEFWKAEETPSFICSAHRRSIVHSVGPQACSVCAKRKSRKFDMYFITYRMAVEFYMTAGKYLAIGRLACSGCKAKSLKGLDFSNSYLVPDYGHPLDQGKEEEGELRKGIQDVEEEEEEKRSEKREVILQPIPSTQGKLATIQPLPPRPQALPLIPPSISLTTSPITTESTTHKIQKLHSALTAVNPGYRAPGFTITSLSECSDGVLQDAIRATQVAVSTLLSAIAPGQEASLWHHVKSSMDRCLFKEESHQATNTQANQ